MSPTKTYWRGRPVVYRVYDADGRLIYIGASRSLPHRLDQHRMDSWWFELIDRIQVRLFPTIEAAFAAEAVAIQEEMPAFNVKHTGRGDRDFKHWTLADYRMCKGWQQATWSRDYLPQSIQQVDWLSS